MGMTKKGMCAHCGRKITFLGKFVNAWVHVASNSIWCGMGEHVRARPL